MSDSSPINFVNTIWGRYRFLLSRRWCVLEPDVPQLSFRPIASILQNADLHDIFLLFGCKIQEAPGGEYR
jgi:hypothetical protein